MFSDSPVLVRVVATPSVRVVIEADWVPIAYVVVSFRLLALAFCTAQPCPDCIEVTWVTTRGFTGFALVAAPVLSPVSRAAAFGRVRDRPARVPAPAVRAVRRLIGAIGPPGLGCLPSLE